MTDIILQFKDVCFAYENAEILHNVSFFVNKGDMVAVVGPNGAGKSTLLKLSLGLLKPLRGKISVFNHPPVKVRTKIGYVPQYLIFDQVFPVNVLDVVLLGRVDKHLFGPFRKKDKIIAMDALEKVELSKFASRAFSKLSGGERQRVLIAQALVSNPELLLLDEPTANVDNKTELEIFNLLNRLNQDITIVMVSHNLNVVTRHASHVLCVNKTASILSMKDYNESNKLHTVVKGDVAVLQHCENCQINDPSSVFNEPHHAKKGDL